jgi:hypothetical protein
MKVPEGTMIQLCAEADYLHTNDCKHHRYELHNHHHHNYTPGVCSALVTLTPADTRMEGLIMVLMTEESCSMRCLRWKRSCRSCDTDMHNVQDVRFRKDERGELRETVQ